MNDIFTDSFERLLAGVCDTATVRGIEAGGDAAPLWAALSEAGFADILVPEAEDGAGLSLLDAVPLFVACGRHALPVPLAHTMLVRPIVPAPDRARVSGSIAIAQHAIAEDGLRCVDVPFGMTCDWVMIGRGGAYALWPAHAATREADGIHASLDASLAWRDAPEDAIALPPCAARELGAAVTALLIAGALERVLEMTIGYANDRSQFGRPIGKFQAIQQQISVLAEVTFAARMAANLACPSPGHTPSPYGTAVAKSYASEAAARAASIAHAVHGAIGITAEHDLSLYTRRLHAWRRAFGAESHWQERLGAQWLDGDATALDFTRAGLARAD
jgi:acyl-CoA dehydrogenase